MNIAIGKIGRSMYFDEKDWSIYAGDDSPKIIYFELAKAFPNDTFYIIGVSDFKKFKEANSHKIFGKVSIPNNIVDVFADMKAQVDPDRWRKSTDTHARGNERWRLLDEYIEKVGLKFDLGIFMQGPDGATSVGGCGVMSVKGDKENTPMLMMHNYAGPIIYNLNKQGYPWYVINEDPRYLPSKHKDIFNQEQLCLSQINDEKSYSVNRLENGYKSPYVPHTVKYKYAMIERMFLANMKKVDYSNPDHIEVMIKNDAGQLENRVLQKKNKFILTLNDGYDRLAFLEKWILSHDPDIKVYGKWGDEAKAKYPNTFIEKGIVQMQDTMWESMFTFVPAFDKQHKNFVTQKVWKMIYYGIIPFWDKNSYDTDNLFAEVPDYVKVSSPDEMWQKIDELYNDREKYKTLLKQLYDLLKPEYFDGSFIANTFRPYIEKHR